MPQEVGSKAINGVDGSGDIAGIVAAPFDGTKSMEFDGVFGVAVWTSGKDLNEERTAVILRERIDLENPILIEVFIEDVMDVVGGPERAPLTKDRTFEDSYLFPLCRKIRKSLGNDDHQDYGRLLAPLGLLLVDMLDNLGKLPPEPELSSAEYVSVAFEAIWGKVRYPEGTDLLKAALEKARENPKSREQGNLGLFISFAWHLQDGNGREAIYLPVNETVAKLFGVSPRAISYYVTICEKRGYMTLKSKCVPNQKCRTWRFDCDHQDFRVVKRVYDRD